MVVIFRCAYVCVLVCIFDVYLYMYLNLYLNLYLHFKVNVSLMCTHVFLYLCELHHATGHKPDYRTIDQQFRDAIFMHDAHQLEKLLDGPGGSGELRARSRLMIKVVLSSIYFSLFVFCLSGR